MKYYPPPILTVDTMKTFIKQTNFIFRKQKQKIRLFEFEMSSFISMDILGQLLIYKFISYTAIKKIFHLPKINWAEKCKAFHILGETGLYDIIQSYTKNDQEKSKVNAAYKALKIKTTADFIFAPRAIIRSQNSDRTVIENDFNMELLKYYNNSKALSIICYAMNEVLMNYWAHATNDNNTVMIAKGNSQTIEIVFIDNGQGIANTLRNSIYKYKKYEDYQLLKESLKPGVTSKINTDHIGYGLYYVKELVQSNNGMLTIVSGNGYAKITTNREKYGAFPYWKGTITHIVFSLDCVHTISEIPELTSGPKIELNWR